MTTPLPNGFLYMEDFVSPSEERVLIQNIQKLNWQHVALFGQIAKRRVVHFGMDYNYERRSVSPIEPAPEFLTAIIARGAELLNVKSNDIAEILITEYPMNAGIGWHRDAPIFESVLGISLHSPCPIHLRKRTEHSEKLKLILDPRSAYTLTESVRWGWEHRIAPVKELRYSITLRTLK